MSLHRRILAALIALAFLSLAPVHGAATLDRAMCSVADRAAGNPATCEGSEGVDSANQELSKLYDGSVLVATVGGSANAITGSTTPSAPALVDGMMRQIKPIVSNTGAATYNDNGLGAKQLVASNGAALSSGDLQTTTVYLMRYYAANDEWRVLTPLGTGVASASNAYVTVGNTGSLSAERAITPDGSTLEGIDGGANSTYTIREKDSGTTNAKLATMAANTIKCNATGGSANPTDCTASTSKTLLAITGADVANTPAGNIAATTAQAAINELDTEKQPLDSDLTALAGNSTAGLWAYTGAGTGAARTLIAPAAGLIITNPAGTAGNPTFNFANDLASVEGLNGAGFAVRVATDTWARRTITGTANEITVTNGDGVSGDPTVSIPSALTFTGKTVTGGTFSGPAITVPGSGMTFNGSTSGAIVVQAAAVAGTNTVTIPAVTDTLTANAASQTLTNKSMSGASNTFTNLPNSALTNTATTVNSQTCTLGATCTVTVPVATGVTGLGTGVATALAINVGSAGAPVVNGGAGGTPSSITLTNGTGLPATGLSGTLQAAQFPALTGDVTTVAGNLATTIQADAVALGTDTTGNYQSGNTAGTGIAVTQTPAEAFSPTVALDYSDAGADPALGADQGRFTSNATVPGNLVFEGDTADSFETRFDITDPTADRTVKIPDADTVTVQAAACSGTDKISAINATTGAVTCSADVGAGSGTGVSINGSGTAAMNLNASTPAAPAGGQNVTWQVSAGSPDQVSAYVPLSSSTTQVMFNDGGSALGGDADMTWDKTNNTITLGGTDTEAVIKGVTNEPSAPSSGNLTLYTKDMGGKMTARVKGPSGAAFPLQDALWQGSQYVWTTTGATAGLWTNTVGAGAGTFTAQTSVSTSPYTAMKRSRWANVVTTTNQVLGQRNTDATFYVGANGGFFYAARFGFDVWTNGGRLCACMHTATTVVSSNPSTIANTVGFIIDAADNGLISFSTRDGTTLNKTSTGLTAVTGNGYEVQMFIPPGGSTIAWRILDMNAGTVASGSTSSNLPVAGTFMTAGVLASNAALTPVTSIQLGVSKIYVQTDN